MGTHLWDLSFPPPLLGCRSFQCYGAQVVVFLSTFFLFFLSLAYRVILKHELCVLMMRVFDQRIWSPLNSNRGQATQITYLRSTVTINCIFYEIQQRPYHHLNTIKLTQTTQHQASQLVSQPRATNAPSTQERYADLSFEANELGPALNLICNRLCNPIGETWKLSFKWIALESGAGPPRSDYFPFDFKMQVSKPVPAFRPGTAEFHHVNQAGPLDICSIPRSEVPSGRNRHPVRTYGKH